MKQICTIVLILLFSNKGITQEYECINKGEQAMKNREYQKAIRYFKEAEFNDSLNAYLQYQIGKSYYNLNEYNLALPYFESAKPYMKDSMKYNFDLYHLYSILGYTALAKEAFVGYVNACRSCVKSDLLPGTSSNRLLYKKPIPKVELMGQENKKPQYFPYLISDNQVQHLNYKIDETTKADATQLQQYMTDDYTNTDYLFYNGENFKQIDKNCGYLYGPFSLNTKLNEIYITRNDVQNNRLYIYYSRRSDTGFNKAWAQYVPVTIELDNQKHNFVHPMLSADEKQLYFASDLVGGLGGYDLWVGDIEGKTKITNVKNLGTYVNTPGDELFPVVYDESTMFFSSNGHYGLGSLDMYAAILYKNKYRKTVNLGTGFNSEFDDYAIFYNDKKNEAIFTSNRYLSSSFGMPYDRIYKTKFTNNYIKVSVLDENNNYIQKAKVSIPSSKVEETTIASALTLYAMPMGYKKLVVQADDYLPVDTFLFPFANEMTIVMQKKEAKDNVSFNFVSAPSNAGLAAVPFILTSNKDGKQYSGTTDYNGTGRATLYGDETYTLTAPQYNFKKDKVSFANPLEIQTFVLTQDKAKPVSNSNNQAISKLDGNFTIYYNSDNSVSNENVSSVNREVDALANILKNNPNDKVELISHTDCQGSPEFNMNLSKKRSLYAVNLLKSHGINEKQIIAKYVGENQPANDCKCDMYNNYNCSSDKFVLNRRTEVRLIKK